MFKHAKVRHMGRVIKVAKGYIVDLSIVEYGVDENIEAFLRMLFPNY